MAIEIQGRVGVTIAQDGTLQDPRLLKDGSSAVADAHGRYYETNYRGNIYSVSNAVAGVAPGTALGTAPPLTLYNPVGSPVNLVLIDISMGYVSGTWGAGTVVLAWNPQTTNANPTGGTQLTPRSNRVGSPTQGQGLAFTGSTVAATQSILRPVFSLNAFAGGATAPAPPMVDYTDGKFMVLPGNCLSLQGIAAAGTTPLAIFGMSWEEIPV
jgi:hypothetical protein